MASSRKLQKHLSDEAILEATYITTMYIQQAILTRALRLEWDDVPEPVVEVHDPRTKRSWDRPSSRHFIAETRKVHLPLFIRFPSPWS